MKHICMLLIGLVISSTALADSQQTRRELARELAMHSQTLLPKLANQNYQAPLQSLLAHKRTARSISSLSQLSAQANQQAIGKMGLTGEVDSLMQLRLATPDQQSALSSGVAPLVAYIPDGDESQWSSIEAFDRQGNSVLLDVNKAPDRPVLVVETDAHKAAQAGIRMMNRALKKEGLSSDSLPPATEPLKTSILSKIRLENDEEPWILGDAEIYAIVAGINPGRDEPVVDIIDMPYLDHDKTVYTPNQILIYWDRYRWAAADLVLMEQDSNTNYKELTKLLVEVLKESLKIAGYPQSAPFLDLGNRIIDAIPDDWMTNSDDYVDSFYTLEQNRHYQDYSGARNNAVISLEPREFAPTH
ncbi:DUF3103 family protein [Dongshaea marina]|uniref:DUF3103 family protein n=1 Tax=Dongshaea marina TaxID=2047966 RepID=UPI000D3EA2C3|nr:DUF3103 family protein [Dongshaea marina]